MVRSDMQFDPDMDLDDEDDESEALRALQCAVNSHSQRLLRKDVNDGDLDYEHLILKEMRRRAHGVEENIPAGVTRLRVTAKGIVKLDHPEQVPIIGRWVNQKNSASSLTEALLA